MRVANVVDRQHAESTLKDYLLNGLLVSINEAEQARALAAQIGEQSARINATGLGSVFGALQRALSDRETLAAAKLFDPPNGKYPVRSIGSVIHLLGIHAPIWQL